MGTYQPYHERPQRRRHWASQPCFLLSLIMPCIIGILVLLPFLIGQLLHGSNLPEPDPTQAPVVVFVSPTPSPVPSSTPSPTPSPVPSSTPSPTPSLSLPPPGVLGYPLYRGNPHLPEIALTFDDGPTPSYTAQILAILQRYGVRATFFVIGTHAASYPALVQKEFNQGMVVGNHTWSHPQLTKLTPAQVRAQLERATNQIQTDIGVSPTVFRPPYGVFNSSVQSIAANLGLSTILWSVDPKDWTRPGTGVIVQRVLTAAHNGSIILLHDGGGNRSETVAALPRIITTLEQRGLQFVTIPEMIQHLPPT